MTFVKNLGFLPRLANSAVASSHGISLALALVASTCIAAALPAAAQTAAPANCETVDKVQIANTGHVLIFLAGNMAKTSGIFEKLCLDLEIVTTNTQVEGLLSGALEFIEPNTMEAVKTFAVNRHLIAVAPMLRCYTNSLVVRKDIVERLGLTRDSPLQERIEALRGLRFGVTNLGQGAGLWVLLLLDEGGLSLGDVQVHQLDNAPGMIAAFRTDQIDVLSSGSPAGEQLEADGLGYRLITGPGGDYPEFGPQSGFPYTSVMTSRAYAEANPDIVTRVVAGYLWANAEIQTNREAVKVEARTNMFPNLPEAVFDEAFDFTYPCLAGPQDRYTEQDFESVVRIANLGRANAGLPLVEAIEMNDIMTNDFVERAQALVEQLRK